MTVTTTHHALVEVHVPPGVSAILGRRPGGAFELMLSCTSRDSVSDALDQLAAVAELIANAVQDERETDTSAPSRPMPPATTARGTSTVPVPR